MLPQRLEPRDLVEAHLFANEDDVVQEALHHLVAHRPDVRIALAVHRYANDEAMTLATAAALADVSIERVKDELVKRGIEPRLGPATIAEARAELAALKRSRHALPD